MPSLKTLVAIALAVLAVGVGYLVFRSSETLVLTSHQPTQVHYQSFDPYTLEAFSSDQSIRFWVYGAEKSTGHGATIEITGRPGIRTVNWLPDGISVEFASNHRLFIPKSAFTGGR